MGSTPKRKKKIDVSNFGACWNQTYSALSTTSHDIRDENVKQKQLDWPVKIISPILLIVTKLGRFSIRLNIYVSYQIKFESHF